MSLAVLQQILYVIGRSNVAKRKEAKEVIELVRVAGSTVAKGSQDAFWVLGEDGVTTEG